MPSHHTPPSGVSATLVKIEFVRQRRHRVGIGFFRSPRRHAKESRFGIDGPQPSRSHPGVIHAMSSPTVQTFHPLKPSGGTIMATLVLPQALGKAAAR